MPRGDNRRNPEFQRKMRERQAAKYSRADYQAWGRKGWDATVAKYGADFGYEAARQHRLGRPSPPEQAMMKLLDACGIEYRREERVISIEGNKTLYSMDFYLVKTHQCIEVDSGVHDIDPQRSERQWAQKQRLLKGIQVPVLVIRDERLKTNEEKVKLRVREFVQNGLSTVDERLGKLEAERQWLIFARQEDNSQEPKEQVAQEESVPAAGSHGYSQ